MADSLLTSSITALRTKIINDIASASVKELVQLARSAKALGLTEDTSVESAINTRANTLTSGASVEEIKDLAQAVKQVKNDVAGSTISSADDIIDGVNNKFLSTANLNTELQSLTTDIKPDADVTRNLGEALYKFNTVYAAKVAGLLAPQDANDAATKSYVDAATAGGAEISTLSVVQSGNLTVVTGTDKSYVPYAININKIVARVETAPTGSAIIIDLLKNDVSINTSTISDGATKTTNNSLSLALVEDDYLTIDVTQIGSTSSGADLTLTLYYTKT